MEVEFYEVVGEFVVICCNFGEMLDVMFQDSLIRVVLNVVYCIVLIWMDNIVKLMVVWVGNGMMWGLIKVQNKYYVNFNMIQKMIKFL